MKLKGGVNKIKMNFQSANVHFRSEFELTQVD